MDSSTMYASSELEFRRLKEQLDDAIEEKCKTEEAIVLREMIALLCRMKRFQKALTYCRRHVSLCVLLADPMEHSYALLNLAMVHYYRGKWILSLKGDFQDRLLAQASSALRLSARAYRLHLNYARQLQLLEAEANALYQLGNVYCLLGKYNTAILYLEQRLKIAFQQANTITQRRVYTNLANACMYQGNPRLATSYHYKALEIAIQTNNKAVEAQAMENLSNHLKLAKELHDDKGECLAYWALGKIHSSLGRFDNALKCANRHLYLARKLHRRREVRVAMKNIAELRKALKQ